MFKINEDKLTPFDRQVINMVRLTPDAWSLGVHWMSHPDFGTFSGRLMQLKDPPTKRNFRRLSLRGRVALTREHRHMLQRPVSIVMTRPPATQIQPQQSAARIAAGQAFRSHVLQQHNMTASANRQAEANKMMGDLASLFAKDVL